VTATPKSASIRNPLVWPAGLLALYLAIPFALFALRIASPGPHGFRTPGLFPALATSVLTASIATGLVAACGIPLAYLLATSKGRLATLIGIVVHLPLALPPLMSGILLIYVVGPYTFIGQLFHGRLTDSLAGIVMAQMFVSAPFLIITAKSAFQAVDPTLFDAATTMGHGRLSRFRYVGLPLAEAGIRAGLTLTWLRAFGEYGATVILAYHPFSLPVYSYTQFSSVGLTTTEAPTALALLTAVAVLGVGSIRIRRRTRPTGPPPPPPIAPRRCKPTNVSFDLDQSVGSFHLDVTHEKRSVRLAILGPSGSG
jgi:ABC-type sulfate transport system permease component